MELKDKIKLKRKEFRLTQKDLADKLEVAPTAVSAWERGANRPLIDKIEIMASIFEVPLGYFFDEREFSSNATISIPILGEIPCGEPITAEENIIGYKERSVENLPKGNFFYLIAKGDSMEPKIPNGSSVLIKEQPEVENGEIAAVIVNGDNEATLKKVRYIGETVVLEPLNHEYEPYIITKESSARIIGKAIEVVSAL